MSRDGGDYRGLLAGVGAGAMAVLVTVPLLFWLEWHRIQGPVGIVMMVVAGSIGFVAATVALYVAGRLWVLFQLHVREPDTARFTVRARPPMQALPPSAGELPGGVHYHDHFHAADAAMDSLEAGYRGLPDSSGGR
jgi:hypothetical protein